MVRRNRPAISRGPPNLSVSLFLSLFQPFAPTQPVASPPFSASRVHLSRISRGVALSHRPKPTIAAAFHFRSRGVKSGGGHFAPRRVNLRCGGFERQPGRKVCRSVSCCSAGLGGGRVNGARARVRRTGFMTHKGIVARRRMEIIQRPTDRPPRPAISSRPRYKFRDRKNQTESCASARLSWRSGFSRACEYSSRFAAGYYRG